MNNKLIIGITGSKGFIGKHLVNYLKLKDEIDILTLDKETFNDSEKLLEFVSSCDKIVHLAALNRHEDEQVIYKTNITLVEKLITACLTKKVSPHILISSSTQEHKKNLYGQSKRDGRRLLEAWAIENDAIVTGMVIPNVFGPFGKPFYNSVVATFCHLLANGGMPEVHNDGQLNLIYINELLDDIYSYIKNKKSGKVDVSARHSIKVTELRNKLNEFKLKYLDKGVFPDLTTPFDLALFNTYRTYIPHSYYPRKLVKHSDDRGSFIEVTRSQSRGQFSFSTTRPGITRGNHFHTRKAERFTVISGKAQISIRKVDSEETIDYIVDGEEPAYVDMPIWYTHNITNIGEEELLTLFWINEPYDQKDPDTYFVEV